MASRLRPPTGRGGASGFDAQPLAVLEREASAFIGSSS